MVETNWGKAKCMLPVKAVHSPDPDPSEANCCYISDLYAAFAFGFAFLNLEYRKTPSRARPVPRAFIGEIGVLKKITDDTMTTTRLTEFATEWVTGDILANKLYETC